jgi:hypothetical protein
VRRISQTPERYLVYATPGRDRLESNPCATLRLADEDARKRLRRLGEAPYRDNRGIIERIEIYLGPADTTQRVHVFGSVSLGGSTAPAGSRVELMQTGFSATLDTSGRFIWRDVHPGLYYLRITAPGAEPEQRYVRVHCPARAPVVAGACQWRFDLHVPL